MVLRKKNEIRPLGTSSVKNVKERIHPQVPVNIKDYGPTYVDEKIQPLIDALNKSGVTTMFSCQGEDFFTDQTHWAGRDYRAYVMMKHDVHSMSYVYAVIRDMNLGTKYSLEIDFSWDPRDESIKRVTLTFPQQNISWLTHLASGMF